MTAKKLHELLGKIIEQKKGHYPVKLQLVEEGITFAQDVIDCDQGHPYDGELVWIYTDSITQNPRWLE